MLQADAEPPSAETLVWAVWYPTISFVLVKAPVQPETRAVAGGAIAPRAASIVPSDVAAPEVPLRVYPARGWLC